MNKHQLVENIAELADLNKTQAAAALAAITDTITNTLAKGDTVSLFGFGTFGVKHRAARTGRNPKTGDAIEIDAATIPNFKPGKALKDVLNTK